MAFTDLRVSIAAVAGIAVFTLCITDFVPTGGLGRRLLSDHRSRLDRYLRFLRSKVTGWQVALAELIISIAVLSPAIWHSQWLWALPLPVVLLGPTIGLAQLATLRISAIDRQVEPWINTVANALRASPSLGDAIVSSATLVQPPMSQELDVLVKEYELGTPLDEALENLSERVGSRTLSATVQALKIARRSGGNLTDMLQSAAESLREFARLEGIVRTKAAEGKAQVFVIGLVPLPLVLGINYLDSKFFEPLLASLLGQLITSIAIVLWLAAIFLARNILDVNI